MSREAFWSWIYPSRCVLCDRIGHPPICRECREDFQPTRPDVILHSAGDPLDYHITAFSYRGSAGAAVRALKFRRQTALAKPLAEITRDFLADQHLMNSPDRFVPVPIHWRRRSWRGFNQAEMLCEALPSNQVGRREVLRTRFTPPLYRMPTEQRARAVAGAFAAKSDVSGLHILLIDDVYTTGTTGRACAEVLKAAGAERVGLFALTLSLSTDLA